QELVAQSLALGRTPHESRDVYELDHRRHLFLGLHQLVEPLQPRVGHLDHADVGLDGAEGIVLRGRGLGGGERVEESRLADVRETDYSETKHVVMCVAIAPPRRSSAASRSPPARAAPDRTTQARTRTSR